MSSKDVTGAWICSMARVAPSIALYKLKMKIPEDDSHEFINEWFDKTVFELLLDPSRNLTLTGFSF